MEKYINSLYWATTTMTTVGYGDIKPTTALEMLVVILCMSIAVANFTLILNTIAYQLANYKKYKQQEKENVDYVKQFMKNKKLPKNLRNEVECYLENQVKLKTSVKIDEEEVMDILNESLRSKLILEINGRHLARLTGLRRFPIDLLSNMTFLLQKKSFITNEPIFYEGDEGNYIALVTYGKVCMVLRKSGTFLGSVN